MKTFAILLLWLTLSANILATTFTEFYVNPNLTAGCSNVNAGSTSTGTFTYKSRATAAGGWNGTSVFTPDDGTTPASTVSAGMWASIYTNGVNTNTPFVARITTVAAGVNGAITVDTTAKLGTAPTAVTGAGAAITIIVGGTWSGPATNAAGGTSAIFPYGFMGPNATNAAGSMACYNWIGGTNYNTSNAITHSVNGPYRIEGYTNTPHDGGKAFLNGGSIVAAYNLLTTAAQRVDWVNMGFDFNGGNNAAVGVSATGNGCLWMGCIVRNMRSTGFDNTAQSLYVECEFATNNLTSAALQGGVRNNTALATFIRCYFHDNTGVNTAGAYCVQSTAFFNCIFARNGKGLNINTTGDPILISGCDFYSNADYGFDLTGGAPAVSQLIYIENSNFITNGTFGVNSSTAATQFKRNGGFYNLGFGSGNRTNSSGSFGINLTNVFQGGIVTYASGVTPWVAPDSGDFRINLGAAYGTGRGTFTENSTTLSGTVGYPSIGAAQPAGFTNATSSAFTE